MLNPGQYVHFCSHYDRLGSDPGRMRAETITSPGSKKSIRVDFFEVVFCSHLIINKGPARVRPGTRGKQTYFERCLSHTIISKCEIPLISIN